MTAPSIPGSSTALGTWDWWRGVDDLWRWGSRAREMWADDLAGDVSRCATRQRRIASMLQHARGASPFYARHFQEVAPECTDLQAYPSVTRAGLMANFDEWVTDPRIRLADVTEFIEDPNRLAEPFLGQYTIWTSSGTSGVPGVYVQDADALATYSALLTTRFQFGSAVSDSWRLVAGPARMAMVAAVEGHFAGIVSWERQRRLHPSMAASARAFSILQPLPELVAKLNDWAPAFVSSYPTLLALLAREQREGRLIIQPRGLWSGGECLSPGDRAMIEASFGCPIVESYGASECMNMAFACPYGRLHLNDDWVVLEPVDENFRPVPPGEASATVLVTNLANRVQPMIRYDLSDSITLDERPCECGCRRPSVGIAGRCDDVVVLEAAGREQHDVKGGAANRPCIRVLPLALETVIEEEARVHGFQLTQTAGNAMSVRLHANNAREQAAAFRRVSKVLERFLKRQGAAPVKLTLETSPPEVSPVSGKLRQIRVLAGAGADS